MPKSPIESIALAAAIAASACGPTAPAPETSEPTPIVFTATGRPSEAPPPAKTPEKTLDERAKEGTLNTWKELLSSTRENTADAAGTPIVTRLKMEIVNPDVWGNVFQQALIGKSATPLRVRWVATQIIVERNNSFFGQKHIGEAEFNNIAVEAVSEKLSDADKANGIQWSGIAGLGFLSRSRSVLAKTSGRSESKEAFERWVSNPNPDQAFSEFSPWQNDSWGTALQLRNDQWSRQLLSSLAKAGLITRDFELPTTVLGGCDPKACKTVEATIK